MGGGREGAAGEHLEGAVSPAEEGTLGEMPLGEGTLGGRGGRPRCSRRRATVELVEPQQALRRCLRRKKILKRWEKL